MGNGTCMLEKGKMTLHSLLVPLFFPTEGSPNRRSWNGTLSATGGTSQPERQQHHHRSLQRTQGTCVILP